MNHADEAIRIIRERRLASLPEVGEDAPAKFAPEFGKYRGRKVVDIPTPYLVWFRDEFSPWPDQRYLLAAVVMELEHRRNRGDGK
jgi:uncharacterized protein (DUF3820 family)